MQSLKDYASDHMEVIKQRMVKRRQTCCPTYILIEKHDNSCKTKIQRVELPRPIN